MSVSLESFKAEYEKGVKMSFQLQIEEMPDYVVAEITGAGVTEEAARHFEFLAGHCKRTNKNKLLLDCTGVPPDSTLVDLYHLGERSLVFARFNCKVAIVCKPDQYDSKSFLETTARNRGVNLRVFTNIAVAEQWLLK